MTKPRKRIADLILKDPAGCVFFSLREMAQKSNTTDVTVLNFCKGLGLNSFQDLKGKLKEIVISWTAGAEKVKLMASRGGSAKGLLDKFYQGLKTNLESSFRLNKEDKFLNAAELLATCDQVFCVGHNASRRPAEHFVDKCLLMGVEVYLIRFDAPQQTLTRLAMVDDFSKSLLISISMPPYSSTTLGMTRLFKEKGGSVISFTDSNSSPLCELSDVSFICPGIEALGEFSNPYSTLYAMIDALMLFYHFRMQEDGVVENSSISRNYAQLENDLEEFKSLY